MGIRDRERPCLWDPEEEGKGKEVVNECVRKTVSGVCLEVGRSKGVENEEG